MITYIGNGDFFVGIPARDMTPDEWFGIPRELREAALKAGLYIIEDIDDEETEVKNNGES